MPSRVTLKTFPLARDDSPPSESDISFVSAEEGGSKKAASAATSRRSKGSGIDQSATLTPSSLPRSVAPKKFPPSSQVSKHDNNTTTIGTPNRTKEKITASHTSFSLPRLSNPPSPPAGSYFPPQPIAFTADPRSPPTKRPPASRSSHGIETKSGPPPALSTRGSYNEPLRRNSASAGARVKHPPLTLLSSPIGSIDPSFGLPDGPAKQDTRIFSLASSGKLHSRPSTSDGIMTAMEAYNHGGSEIEEEKDSTLRIKDRSLQRGTDMTSGNGGTYSQAPDEDLFLNLARNDSTVDEPSKRSESRRSRVGTSSFSQPRASRPSSSGRPSTGGEKQTHPGESSFDSYSPRSPGKSSLTNLRDASLRNRPYAASAHPLEQRQRTPSARPFAFKTQEAVNEKEISKTPMPYGRRRSIREPSPSGGAHDWKQSHLSHTPSGDYGPSPNYLSSTYTRESMRDTPPAEGTESTVSTTAPSTVWDELDELKSRMRKLELSGLLTKSSNTEPSNVNGNRPTTATTTVTTISSSPKRHQLGSISPEASTLRTGGLNSLHPVLHSALAKVKPVADPSLYRALEATASDALTLVAISGSAGSQGTSPGSPSVIGLSNGIDRSIRRKADNMCRSLTELCIALAEGLPSGEAGKRRSENQDAGTQEMNSPNTRLLRGPSDEPEKRASSNVMKRLEARRSSLLASSSMSSRTTSPQEVTTPTQTSTPFSSRLDRHSSTALRTRLDGQESETSSSRRPSSRAATEVGQMRPSPQTRISREYTSRHPMPGSSQQSPPTEPSLPTRKSYFGSTISSPRTPSVQPGSRRYLDRSTPPSSADSASARIAEARQRRLASLGQDQSRLRLGDTESQR